MRLLMPLSLTLLVALPPLIWMAVIATVVAVAGRDTGHNRLGFQRYRNGGGYIRQLGATAKDGATARSAANVRGFVHGPLR
jgi:hypothetical protein